MPVVDLGPDTGGPEVLSVIMRKHFLQSGPRSTEFGKGDNKLWKIKINAGLLLLSGLWFGVILTNGKIRSLWRSDKLKNVQKFKWNGHPAADYSSGS